MKNWDSKRVKLGIILVFLLACYFPIFLKLDAQPIKIWDESLFAMRAFYMADHSGYLANFDYFPGITFYRNLKPPLITIPQALSFKLLGYNELALRLPIALFVLASIYLTFQFYQKHLNSIWPGIWSGLILVTSAGYIRPHVARTGDHDVPFAFFILLLTILFFKYERSQGKIRNWYLAGLGLFLYLAFLTKSIMAFFVLPGFLVYSLYKKGILRIISDIKVWGTAFFVFGSVLLYYLTMEYFFPEFWKYVTETVYGRYVEERNNQGQVFSFYWTNFCQSNFFPWILLLPINLILLWKAKFPTYWKDWIVLLWIVALTFLLIISFSETKLVWYDAAVYPIMSALGGITIYKIFEDWLTQSLRFRALSVSMLLLIFCIAYSQIIDRVYNAAPLNADEKYAVFMKKVKNELPDLKEYTILCNPFNGQVGFYTAVFNKEKAYDIKVKLNSRNINFKEDLIVLCCHPGKLEKLKERYELEPFNWYQDCTLVKLNRR